MAKHTDWQTIKPLDKGGQSEVFLVRTAARAIEQLARAEKYKAEFTRRDACTLYVWYLHALRIKFPPMHKLLMVLDPDGSVFPGFYAFERFVQRRRKEVQLS